MTGVVQNAERTTFGGIITWYAGGVGPNGIRQSYRVYSWEQNGYRYPGPTTPLALAMWSNKMKNFRSEITVELKTPILLKVCPQIFSNVLRS